MQTSAQAVVLNHNGSQEGLYFTDVMSSSDGACRCLRLDRSVRGLAWCGLLPYASDDDDSWGLGNNKRSVCSQETFLQYILAWGVPGLVTFAAEFP